MLQSIVAVSPLLTDRTGGFCVTAVTPLTHESTVMRVQSIPSMLSVCGVNGPYCPAER
uniref:Uncharacterized protein n=1 Tax=Anguilla anguilla TaxID=7936 RepID=A0A0E9XWU8_ANGAN